MNCMDTILWPCEHTAPLAYMIGARIAVAAFGEGFSVWKYRKETKTSEMAARLASAKEAADAYGRIATILSIMRARGGDDPYPYRMRKADEKRMEEIFCKSGHMMPELLYLYIKCLEARPRADAGRGRRSSILKEMHELAKSKYEELKERCRGAV